MSTLNDKLYNLLSGKKFNLIAFGIIAVLVLIAYSNTFNASFHFDDIPSITDNYTIKVTTADNIYKVMMGSRSVVYLSLMLNYAIGGLNVFGYHVFNISVHILNSIFVYLLTLWTLSLPQSEERSKAKARLMALFAALLFGVHPVQTESVTYIITRTELLATVFYLGAFLLFIQGVRKNSLAYFISAGFSSFLSMASKEWAVTLPAMVFLYDVLFLSEGKVKPALSRWWAYVLIALPWWIIWRNLNLMSSGGGESVGFHIKNSAGIPLTAWTYLLTSFNVIWTYFRLLVLPINQNLDYEYHVAQSLFDGPTFISMLGHIAVVALAFWLYRKKGWVLAPFGMAWFYITLSPTQSFVPVMDVIFEHRIYCPSIGFFLTVVVLYEKLFEWIGKWSSAVKKPQVEQQTAKV